MNIYLNRKSNITISSGVNCLKFSPKWRKNNVNNHELLTTPRVFLLYGLWVLLKLEFSLSWNIFKKKLICVHFKYL
jgi:hypothetical protein